MAELTEETVQQLTATLAQVQSTLRNQTSNSNSSVDSRRGTGGGSGGSLASSIGISDSKNVKLFSDTINKAGSTTAANLSNFASAIDNVPIAGFAAGVMSGLMDYADETQQVFQSLSKVGAGFNGNLMELRQGAADTRMTLGDFAGMVSQNSEALAGFTGGVQGGVRRFRELSNAMFSGDAPVIDGFQRLGFTLNESNEFILKNMEIQQRNAKMRGPGGDEEMLQASLRMAESLDVMAKLSGKQLDQMQEEILATQMQGRVNASLRQMGPDAAAAFSELQIGLANAGDGANAYAKDMLTYGAPISQAAQSFAVSNTEAAASIQNAIGAVKRGEKDAAGNLGQQATAQVAEFAGSAQGLTMARLGGLNPIFDAQEKNLEQTDKLINQINGHQERVLSETGVALDYVTAYRQIVATQSEAQKRQTSGTTPETQISNVLNKAQLEIANTASEINTQLASNLGTNQQMIDATASFTSTFIDLLNQSRNTISNAIDDIIPGQTQDNLRSDLSPEQQDAVRIVNGFKEGLSSVTIDMKNDALALLGKHIDPASGLLVDTNIDPQTGNRRPDRDLTQNPTTQNVLGGGISAGIASLVGEQGPEVFVPNMDGAIIPNMKAMLNRMPDIVGTLQDEIKQFGGPMSEAAKSFAATNPGMMQGSSIEQKLDNLNQTMLQLLNINTMHKDIGNKQIKTMRRTGNLMG